MASSVVPAAGAGGAVVGVLALSLNTLSADSVASADRCAFNAAVR
ncbi:MAG: hypothetical protein Q7T10_04185 [Rhodoferax sp.]|nr:hypothetical protein [Rhodoferax sp.]MDO8447986.1 hypothetical protein [Rhodoferax sp.]